MLSSTSVTAAAAVPAGAVAGASAFAAAEVIMGSGAEMHERSASGDGGLEYVGSAGMDARLSMPPQWRFCGADRDSRREHLPLPCAADTPASSPAR